MNANRMLEIYNASFPSLRTDVSTFSRRLKLGEGSEVLERWEGGVLAGFSVIYGSAILLLVVDGEYRRHGIGSRLLMHSEEHIGSGTAVLGAAGGTYLLCGVPLEGEGVSFFEGRGYEKDWISCDMIVDLHTFKRRTELECPDTENVIRRRGEDEADVRKARECGERLGWGEVFSGAPYLIVAECDGQIIGGVAVDEGCLFPVSLPETGSFGCLGVLEQYRDKGIGMKLCQEALCVLRDSGRSACHIGYTWLDWWYEKTGAHKYMSYWIGKKQLKS
jgi:ribosomal protein S18 acetylase RimI-like enzyme